MKFVINYLLLKGKDMSDASINRVADAGLSFVTDGEDRILPPVHGDAGKELRNVTRPEYLVDGSEMGRALLRIKVGSEHASRQALPPKELARPARSSSSSSSSASTTRIPTTTASGATRARVHDHGDEQSGELLIGF